ncbi:hypothetical protein BN1221_01062 [Brenneria goodwinii]|uniref:Uncharacterized protein n=1 Tax=Brenneria goodwinii TaxID=1109412 RepID=A0A0G4JRV3_9GAMM|nr:hypothetical protein BN1221_01062 [Brenneria goodwinii]
MDLCLRPARRQLPPAGQYVQVNTTSAAIQNQRVRPHGDYLRNNPKVLSHY